MLILLVAHRAVADDDVSINITHCGVCYADVSWTRNKNGDAMYPVVPGYVSHSVCYLDSDQTV